MTQPRPRPTALTEDELGFQPQKAVRWLSPAVLIGTGIKSLVAEIFGSYADKRELQASLPQKILHHQDGDDLWFDFVADLGDGFDATMSVASLLAAEQLTMPDGTELPRGRLLVMGGDEVYPVASTRNYEDRSKGVYRAALPQAEGVPPVLFAVPGNHDWYDGLTAFLRVFAQRRPFGGWATQQTRSYFAVQLPHRWWLLAIDTQFDDYVDAPQLDYFREVAEHIDRGDSVILCTATPAWVPAGSGGETKGYDTIEFFLREIVRPRGAQVRLMLSGDTHHYARYAEHGGSAQRVTCGIGGAYLAATHRLPEKLSLPPRLSRVRQPSDQTEFDLVHRYPDEGTSRKLSWGIATLPWRNPKFWLLTGGFQLVLTLALLLGLVHDGTSAFDLLQAWSPAAIVAFGLLVAGVAFARLGTARGRPLAYWTAGVLHAVAHMAFSVGWAVLALWLFHQVLPTGNAGDWLFAAMVLLGTPTVIGFLDAEIVAVYLLIASLRGINLNEVFAGQSIEDYKGFLRIHLTAEGLTVHPIKVDRVCRDWVPDPNGSVTDPWLKPDCPLKVEPIEPAFLVTPSPLSGTPDVS
ncbi:metallophosphoesterase family protein [Labedaea rhizosphaerae]|uniref:Calcineurin-like phosphoesterase family protein n=1 Tax=Labedaea rhizosphaerae TaxID=598644 RepID=A0A4R6SH10_LABRH|nr:metallophosphoesterase [Labedaea rhizosphaerae]TDQ01312.1 calcineurin-like phosphoesterase family protein [Labedaea rhizosphaerae]